MENDEPKKSDGGSKKDIKEFLAEQRIKIESLYTKKETKAKVQRERKDTRFKKGNKEGLKFGQGQPTDRGGMPKRTTVLEEMKAAAETYGLAANDIASAMVKLSMDDRIDARFRFPFMKESNLRIFGQPKNSLEDTLKHINDKVDKLYELTMPLLEATAIGDGVALVRELMSQGKLDEVVKQIEEEKI